MAVAGAATAGTTMAYGRSPVNRSETGPGPADHGPVFRPAAIAGDSSHKLGLDCLWVGYSVLALLDVAGGRVTTVRQQRVWAIPIRTAHDLVVRAFGVLIATWPLIVLYVLIRTLL
jgi:hypothetical protein